jgi:chemotaxis protein MotB
MARRIKKVEGGHGHHGGAWKVAYADFVTAMMALFMVLWLLASTDSQSRLEISNYFRTGLLPEVELPSQGSPQTTGVFIGAVMPTRQQAQPPSATGSGSGSGSGAGPVDERIRTAEELVNRLNRLATLDPDLAQVMRNVRVDVSPDGIVIEVVDEARGLLFDVSSAKLKEPLERFLRVLGPAISALDRPVEINGHTDARPYAQGARLSNWDLSYQRAAAAREILEASGVASRQIVGVFARGSSQLYLPNEPYSPQNRRLSILVKIARTGGTKVAANEQPPAK